MRAPSVDIASCRVATRPAGSKACGIEGLRRTLQQLGGNIGFDEKQRRRGKAIISHRKEIAIRLLGLDIKRPYMCGSEIRQAGDHIARPFAVGRGADLEHGFQIEKDRKDEAAAAPEETLQCAPVGRLKQSLEPT